MIDPITGALLAGVATLVGYLSEHVITCLVPAFFIAGAIGAFVKKDAILKYFSPDTKKTVSYGIASVSGTVLAVCSCTILPMFAGIYKKGSGIGPAVTFLYAGPAINVLAIIYTAKVLGFDLGLARAVAAVALAIVIGLIMAAIFRDHDAGVRAAAPARAARAEEGGRPWWATLAFFASLVGILIFGASQLPWTIKFPIVYLLTLAVAVLVIYTFERDEVTDWAYETWDLTKKIFPILIAGTFVLGMLAYFLPPETFAPYFGDNSIGATLLAAIVGGILYMPTLLEVPIIGTTFGYTSGVMAGGPALALLLAGPSVSLPSLLVISRVMGAKKTAVYAVLVILFSALAGFVYGNIVG